MSTPSSMPSEARTPARHLKRLVFLIGAAIGLIGLAIFFGTWVQTTTLAAFKISSPGQADIYLRILEQDNRVYLSAEPVKSEGRGWSTTVLLGKVDEVGGRTATLEVDKNSQQEVVLRIGKVKAQFDLQKHQFVLPAAGQE